MKYKILDGVIGLAPTVIENQEIVHYSAILSDLTSLIEELVAHHYIVDEGPHALDGITKEGDILQDFPLSKDGLQYLISNYGLLQTTNPLETMSIENQKLWHRKGYSDLFLLRGHLWGFLAGNVMPVRCSEGRTP